jgi:outer membrane protein assembly factor BamE (lipoprotein component of BamABCDE complex)
MISSNFCSYFKFNLENERIKMKPIKKAVFLIFPVILTACVQAPPATQPVIKKIVAPEPKPAPLAIIPERQIQTQKITIGSIQRAVKKGATNAEVIEALGSPNIVTSNRDNTETWVYEKIATESEYADGDKSGVKVTSSRTLMVVIKYDKTNKVENVQYRQTSY